MKRKGSVLIFALWVLAFLGLFAIQIGLKVRQKVALLSRVEQRSQLRFIAESGIKMAVAALQREREKTEPGDSPESKSFRHHNKATFADIPIGRGICHVRYADLDEGLSGEAFRYGVVDEESKINLNIIDPEALKFLMLRTVTSDEDHARELAEAVIDWREMGEGQITSFYSDDYYANLKDPYPPKDAEFELLDELLLVKGFNESALENVRPFVTVYGDGRVNINTAPKTVLMTLGLDEALSGKILYVRRGLDGIEATPDDYIFQRSYDLASDLGRFVELEAGELNQIDALNLTGKIKTVSFYFSIRSEAELNSLARLKTLCIYNAEHNRIEYWREKFQ